jgi:hypothetical protein
VCIQFPDPWQDDQAAKRVVTPKLVLALAAALPSGGEVFIVSDRRDLALTMRSLFLSAQGDLSQPLFALHSMHQSQGGEPVQALPPRREGRPLSAAREPAASPAPPPPGGWLLSRPYGVPTERDLVCEKLWRRVYRTLLVRTSDSPRGSPCEKEGRHFDRVTREAAKKA